MRLLFALLASLVLATAACGKYGPPQRTVERVPAPAPASEPAPDAPDDESQDR